MAICHFWGISKVLYLPKMHSICYIQVLQHFHSLFTWTFFELIKASMRPKTDKHSASQFSFSCLLVLHDDLRAISKWGTKKKLFRSHSFEIFAHVMLYEIGLLAYLVKCLWRGMTSDSSTNAVLMIANDVSFFQFTLKVCNLRFYLLWEWS